MFAQPVALTLGKESKAIKVFTRLLCLVLLLLFDDDKRFVL